MYTPFRFMVLAFVTIWRMISPCRCLSLKPWGTPAASNIFVPLIIWISWRRAMYTHLTTTWNTMVCSSSHRISVTCADLPGGACWPVRSNMASLVDTILTLLNSLTSSSVSSETLSTIVLKLPEGETFRDAVRPFCIFGKGEYMGNDVIGSSRTAILQYHIKQFTHRISASAGFSDGV